MKIFLIQKSQWVDKPLNEVFDFFKKPENLAKITPESLGFHILTPSPVKMEKGRLIDYTIKVFGLEQRWTTLITEYDPPHLFVDEQVKGPYSFWHHKHMFAEQNGGTLIEDEVRYALPFGWAGNAAHLLFVRRQLETIFEYRSKIIQKALS